MTNWFDHAKAQFGTLPMIDVVNEAVGNHQAGNPMIKETLGGGGKTGYDWLIKAFEMAYERWRMRFSSITTTTRCAGMLITTSTWYVRCVMPEHRLMPTAIRRMS